MKTRSALILLAVASLSIGYISVRAAAPNSPKKKHWKAYELTSIPGASITEADEDEPAFPNFRNSCALTTGLTPPTTNSPPALPQDGVDGPCSGGPFGGGGGPGNGSSCSSCGGQSSAQGSDGRQQQCPACSQSGMPYWKVSEPYINLWIYDEPIGYQPAIGKRMSFMLSHKQRNDTNSPDCYGPGPAWNCSWLTYVEPVGYSNNLAYVALPGGAHEFFALGGADSIDFYSKALLSPVMSSPSNTVGYNMTYPDGHTDTYFTFETNGSGRFFRSNTGWPDGTTNQFLYITNPGGALLLKYVIDAEGGTNVLNYTNTSQPLRITSVQDRFGRVCQLQYHTNNCLTNVTDPAGLSSSFTYDTNFWITSMTTPYGRTSFQETEDTTNTLSGSNVVTRTVMITDPDLGMQLYMYRDNSQFLSDTNLTPLIPGTYTNDNAGVTVPGDSPLSYGGMDNYFVYGRNSFHWDKRHFAACSTTNFYSFTTNDYNRAFLKHWLAAPGAFGTAGSLSMERTPSPDAAGTLPGQFTWYDYWGKTATYWIGTNSLADTAFGVLPNEDEWYYVYALNQWGKPIQRTDTYSDEFGQHTRNTYFTNDSTGRYLTQIVGPDNVQVANYLYASNLFFITGQVLAFTNALGEGTSYTYNSFGQLTSVTTPTGLVTSNYYYTSGPYANWLAQVVAVGYGTNGFSYTNGLLYTYTNSLGYVYTNTWDNLQRLTSATDSRGTVTLQYSNLDLAVMIDKLGNTNSFVHDSMRRLTAATDALGRTTTFSYCECGSLNSVQDALSNVTHFYYDPYGRLTNTVLADGRSTTNYFNLIGQLVERRDNFGGDTSYYYFDQGILAAVSNAFGMTSTFSYDLRDRATNLVSVDGLQTGMFYDDLNRLTLRIGPNGGQEHFYYSAFGLTNYTDPLTNRTFYLYDTAYRPLTVTNANGETNGFTYDAAGHVKTLRDGKGQLTTWNYYPYGAVSNKVDALNHALTFKYDANGRMTNRNTLAKGNTGYAYDAVGNLTNVTHPASPNVAWAYDALNRPTNVVTSGLFTNRYSYSVTSQLLTEDGPWADDTVSYAYNLAGLRSALSLQEPNSAPWTQGYGYDALGRMTSLGAPSGVYNYTYGSATPGSPAFAPVGLALPNGAVITNLFDGTNQLLATLLLDNTATVQNYHGYTYDLDGRVTSQTFTHTNTTTYGYDKIGQLTSALGQELGGTTNRLQEQLQYAYDKAHNLSVRTNNALVETFTADLANELTGMTRNATNALTVAGMTTMPATNVTVNSLTATLYNDNTFVKDGITLADGIHNNFTAVATDSLGRTDTALVSAFLPATNNYTYDTDGNLIADARRGFDYDDDDQLIRVTITNTCKSEFTYDGLGRRMITKDYTWNGSAWVNTNEVHYVYDGRLVIQERDVNNLPKVTYTRRGMTLLARSDNTQMAQLPTTGAHTFYHADAGGNITALMNAQGLVVARYVYDSFGNLLGKAGPLADANLYRFSSKEYNVNSDLTYFGFRFYDANLQRWINRDPIAEAGDLNLYRALANSPENQIDEYGLDNMIPSVGQWGGAIENYLPALKITGSWGPTVRPFMNVESTGGDPFIQAGLALAATPTQLALGAAGFALAPAGAVVDGINTANNPNLDSLTRWGGAFSALGNGIFAALPLVSCIQAGLAGVIADTASEVAAVAGGDGTLAGSIRNVNPTGGNMNCVNCAIATDATLAGNAASALPGGPTSLSVLETKFGGTFQPVSGQMEIGSALSQSGNGARGIVFGESMSGDVGHVFNVLNKNGTIQFLDGQVGGSGLNNFNSFKNFQFLLTHPGTP